MAKPQPKMLVDDTLNVQTVLGEPRAELTCCTEAEVEHQAALVLARSGRDGGGCNGQFLIVTIAAISVFRLAIRLVH